MEKRRTGSLPRADHGGKEVARKERIGQMGFPGGGRRGKGGTEGEGKPPAMEVLSQPSWGGKEKERNIERGKGKEKELRLNFNTLHLSLYPSVYGREEKKGGGERKGEGRWWDRDRAPRPT